VVERMGMGNNYAVGIDVCMPVLKRTLCDKNIYRHKQCKQQPDIFPDKYHRLKIFQRKNSILMFNATILGML